MPDYSPLSPWRLMLHLRALPPAGLGGLIGNPTLSVISFRDAEIRRANHAVSRPGKPHHGAQPWKAPNISAPDAQRRQRQPAAGDHPQQPPNIRDQLLAVLRPAFAPGHQALPSCWANR